MTTFKRFRLVEPNRPCGAFVEPTDVYAHVTGCRVCLDAGRERWGIRAGTRENPVVLDVRTAQNEQEAALPAGTNPVHMMSPDPGSSRMVCGEQWRIGVRHTVLPGLVTCPACK